MTITFDLKPETEASLLALAETRGISVDEFVRAMVEGTVTPSANKTLSAEDRATAYEAWSARHKPTPPLSDYAVSRESMYQGRGQ